MEHVTPGQRGQRHACDLVADPVFGSLATEAVLDYLDWDTLTKRPLPAGLSLDETWRLLRSVRRFGAIHFPIRDLEGREYWYTLTREARMCLDTIERYCRSDSSVDRAILHRHGQRLLVDTDIREAIALCELDGVSVEAAACRDMLLAGRSPSTSTERLVSNVHALIGSHAEWEGGRLTPAMLSRLYADLTEGVDCSQLRRHAPSHGLVGRVETLPEDHEALDQVIARYCEYANDRLGDASEPVAMKAHALLNTANFWAFFPDFNGIIGRLVFKIYATSRDYPVLGYLPVGIMYKAWVDHAGPSFVRFDSLDLPGTFTDTDVDYTPDVLTYLQLTVAALDQMLAAIANVRERDAQVRDALVHDPELNYRQRAVIDRALAHPEREFRIREHQRTHNVVYATARADLLDLAERGYLVMGTEGRAFVFHPSPDLPQRLGRPDAGTA